MCLCLCYADVRLTGFTCKTVHRFGVYHECIFDVEKKSYISCRKQVCTSISFKRKVARVSVTGRERDRRNRKGFLQDVVQNNVVVGQYASTKT